MTTRELKVKGTQLRYTDYSEVEHLLAGALIGGSFDGKLKVKGTYLHYMDNDGGQRRLWGILTGETGTPGRLKVKGTYIRYIDNNGDERYIPTAHYFYSDAHPEEKSVDGQVQHMGDFWEGLTWVEVRAGVGTNADDEGDNLRVVGWGSKATDRFYGLSRVIMLFDTSSIPPEKTIRDAKLRILINTARGAGDYPNYKLALVPSTPASNTQLVPSDYQQVGSTLLALNHAPITEVPPEGRYFTFYFNDLGKAAIAKGEGGITKLGLRDYYYDILGYEPPWHSFMEWGFQITGADYIYYPVRRPRLEVTYD